MVVCVEVTRYAGLTIWWAFHLANATDLSPFAFQFHYFLLRRAVIGFAVGLIPLELCKEILRSYLALARLRAQEPPTGSELDWNRPLLWAWVPFAVVFLVRFAAWRPHSSSVLTSATMGQRFHYFFDESQLGGWSAWSVDGGQLLFDLGAIVGPMLFLMAYTLGVWARYEWPSLQHPTSAVPESEQPFEQTPDSH
jgi:hypothetical protein